MLYLSAWTKSFVCSEKKTSKSDTYKNKGLFFAQNHDHMGWLHVIFTPEFRLKEALLHGKFQLQRERAGAKDSSWAFLLGSGMGQPKRGPWPSLRSVGRKVQNRRHFAIDAIGGKETAGVVPTMLRPLERFPIDRNRRRLTLLAWL